ncbi:EthD domain-containing protein [Schizophyllum fasciatum]
MSDNSLNPPSLRKDRARLAILFRRRKGMSYEDFAHHWMNQHAKVFMGTVVHRHILRYEQMYTSASTAKDWNALLGMPVVQYDGIALLEADSFEDIKKVFTSDEYKSTLFPDELNFVDREGIQFIPLNYWVAFDRTRDESRL